MSPVCRNFWICKKQRNTFRCVSRAFEPGNICYANKINSMFYHQLGCRKQGGISLISERFITLFLRLVHGFHQLKKTAKNIRRAHRPTIHPLAQSTRAQHQIKIVIVETQQYIIILHTHLSQPILSEIKIYTKAKSRHRHIRIHIGNNYQIRPRNKKYAKYSELATSNLKSRRRAMCRDPPEILQTNRVDDARGAL